METSVAELRGRTSDKANEEQIRVAVVDDNSVLLEAITRFLEGEGYWVKGLADGWQACEELFRREYDVVLLDLSMPVMDGLSAIRALRKSDPYTFILAMSGDDNKWKIEQCVEVGANDFFAKPFRLQRLSEILKGMDISAIRRLKRERKALQLKEAKKLQRWDQRIIRKLKKRGFWKKTAMLLLLSVFLLAVSYVAVRFMDRKRYKQKQEILYDKLDELIEVIRQDWGR